MPFGRPSRSSRRCWPAGCRRSIGHPSARTHSAPHRGHGSRYSCRRQTGACPQPSRTRSSGTASRRAGLERAAAGPKSRVRAGSAGEEADTSGWTGTSRVATGRPDRVPARRCKMRPQGRAASWDLRRARARDTPQDPVDLRLPTRESNRFSQSAARGRSCGQPSKCRTAMRQPDRRARPEQERDREALMACAARIAGQRTPHRRDVESALATAANNPLEGGCAIVAVTG